MANINITTKTCTIEPLYQWDLNQILQIYGLALPVVPEVHFAHDTDKLAIVRQATVDAAGVIRVSVPNSLLQKGSRINAYICTTEGSTFQTLYKVVIPVVGRAKPSDYEGTDDAEVFSLDALQVEVIGLEAGADAKVEKVLNGDTWTLRFSIPAATGPKGDPGDKGDAFTYDDFTEEQLAALTGPTGSSIQSITRTSGTGASGSTDTYTILLTDGSAHTFTVYNGRDGEGAGDMVSTVYDPQGKQTDVFKYVDDQIAAIPTPDVSGQISTHNSSTSAHSDIRQAVSDAASAASAASSAASSASSAASAAQSTADTAKTNAATAQARADAAYSLANGKEASGTAAGLLNRTTAVNVADTNYTTLMARGTSLNSADTAPAVNGAIAWTYA